MRPAAGVTHDTVLHHALEMYLDTGDIGRLVIMPRHQLKQETQDGEIGLNFYVESTRSTPVSHKPLARTRKSLKNLFLEKIIIPPRKSIPFNVIKRVQ